MERPAGAALRYTLPFAALLLALVAGALLGQVPGFGLLAVWSGSALLVAVVVWTAWNAGLGPALAGSAGAALLANYYLFAPGVDVSLDPGALAATAGIFAASALVAWATVDRRRTRHALREANRRLRASDAARMRFLRAVAHELQGPLTPAVLQAELLRGMDLPARARASVGVLDRSLDRTTRMVAELLDATRLEQGRLDVARAPFDLAEVVAAAAEDHGPLATKQGIALEVAAPPRLPAVGDARRVEQVVANLLRNAVRATPPGGRIAVHARLHGGAAEVRVEDTGRGLSEAQLQALFQPFGQVHEGAEVPDGTGLGLYLCRGIVEQHGGRLWAESAGPGRGAAFTFTLPQAARHGEEKETAALDASRTPAR